MRTDLTYEGIATQRLFLRFLLRHSHMRPDLTYEGIATFSSITSELICTGAYMRTDLTYEGIATLNTFPLRIGAVGMRTDLTYEGIAT